MSSEFEASVYLLRNKRGVFPVLSRGHAVPAQLSGVYFCSSPSRALIPALCSVSIEVSAVSAPSTGPSNSSPSSTIPPPPTSQRKPPGYREFLGWTRVPMDGTGTIAPHDGPIVVLGLTRALSHTKQPKPSLSPLIRDLGRISQRVAYTVLCSPLPHVCKASADRFLS